MNDYTYKRWIVFHTNLEKLSHLDKDGASLAVQLPVRDASLGQRGGWGDASKQVNAATPLAPHMTDTNGCQWCEVKAIQSHSKIYTDGTNFIQELLTTKSEC